MLVNVGKMENFLVIKLKMFVREYGFNCFDD